MSHVSEKKIVVREGWGMLALFLPMLLVSAAMFFGGIPLMPLGIVLIVAGVILALISLVGLCGFFTLQPNEAIVLSFFGPYVGTVRDAGFYWANPFYSKTKVSLRARNFEGTRLKVNDKQGNPIEIAAVIVWQVTDTAQALFEVENYEEYVKVQSETAVRHLANHYAYDHGEEHEVTLRSGVEVVCEALCKELQERLSKAGVGVIEARLTHLAYAPEIAGAMLKYGNFGDLEKMFRIPTGSATAAYNPVYDEIFVVIKGVVLLLVVVTQIDVTPLMLKDRIEVSQMVNVAQLRKVSATVLKYAKENYGNR